jgi:hypothetical protein
MKISQREARRLRKLVNELESTELGRRRSWSQDWGPGWVQIESTTLTAVEFAAVKTARKLGHAVIVVPKDGTDVSFFAVKL